MEWVLWYFAVGVILAILGCWFDQANSEPSDDEGLIKLAVAIIVFWPLIFGGIFVLCVVHVISHKFRSSETKS